MQRLFDRLKRSEHNRWCRLKVVWVDGAYEDIVTFVRQQFGWTLDIVRHPKEAKGFTVLPRRYFAMPKFVLRHNRP